MHTGHFSYIIFSCIFLTSFVVACSAWIRCCSCMRCWISCCRCFKFHFSCTFWYLLDAATSGNQDVDNFISTPLVGTLIRSLSFLQAPSLINAIQVSHPSKAVCCCHIICSVNISFGRQKHFDSSNISGLIGTNQVSENEDVDGTNL